eukprot:CAMPEP_0173154608 /NCGR_PEP_ID=MMETSP1105-20130129/13586_1 /TAXON_ID=2985 /ORGANISM="Ochromonas sp., Strain BG-1" /LENGTH=219 /DNA_ID=CAMNT_0014070825 /DNA_START=37 /DNA_END=696 /DNA_ORIENTATION=+
MTMKNEEEKQKSEEDCEVIKYKDTMSSDNDVREMRSSDEEDIRVSQAVKHVSRRQSVHQAVIQMKRMEVEMEEMEALEEEVYVAKREELSSSSSSSSSTSFDNERLDEEFLEISIDSDDYEIDPITNKSNTMNPHTVEVEEEDKEIDSNDEYDSSDVDLELEFEIEEVINNDYCCSQDVKDEVKYYYHSHPNPQRLNAIAGERVSSLTSDSNYLSDDFV